MPQENENVTADEQHTYMILNSYDSELLFYAEADGKSPADAIENAVQENDDEDLLPLTDVPDVEGRGFIAVKKEHWNGFGHQ